MSRLFIDANVPTYAAGREHPLKEPCQEVLRLAASHPNAFCTDAEVLQEMLHRYLSLKRWPEGKRVVADFATVMRGSVEAVRAEDAVLACGLVDVLLGSPLAELGSDFRLAARDLLHAAVMRRTESTQIVSADADFDELAPEGIERLDPAEVERWSDEVVRAGRNGA